MFICVILTVWLSRVVTCHIVEVTFLACTLSVEAQLCIVRTRNAPEKLLHIIFQMNDSVIYF